MDPFGHPDLDRLSRSMRLRLDETLDAEQAAARTAAIRRSTMRDHMIAFADRQDDVVIATSDGHITSGIASGVGVDHVIVDTQRGEILVSLAHVVSVEVR